MSRYLEELLAAEVASSFLHSTGHCSELTPGAESGGSGPEEMPESTIGRYRQDLALLQADWVRELGA